MLWLAESPGTFYNLFYWYSCISYSITVYFIILWRNKNEHPLWLEWVLHSGHDINGFHTTPALLLFIQPRLFVFFTQTTLMYEVHVWIQSAGLWSSWSNGWLTAKGLKWYVLPPQSNINALREANTTYVFSTASVFIYPLFPSSSSSVTHCTQRKWRQITI